MELTLQRRHSAQCPDRSKGPNHLKCRGKRPCPLRAIGYDDHGNRVRESLGTRDLTRAAGKLEQLRARLASGSGRTQRKALPDAVKAFLDRHAKRAAETQRKYRCVIGRIEAGLSAAGVVHVDQITVEVLGAYAAAREKANWSWLKELELLRQFTRFCIRREWCRQLDLDELKAPRIEEANQVVPFTQDQYKRILFACDLIGCNAYTRDRARAMVLLMRHAGLRISDVMTLSREHIQGDRLEKRAQKNRNWIRVQLPPVVLGALQRLPQPKEAPQDSPMFFAGQGSLRSLVKGAWRTLSVVFERAGVPDGHPHRFRHTLASELMAKGATYEEIGRILGDDASTIRKHYAKWTPEYQIRQDTLLSEIHGTNLAQAEKQLKSC